VVQKLLQEERPSPKQGPLSPETNLMFSCSNPGPLSKFPHAHNHNASRHQRAAVKEQLHSVLRQPQSVSSSAARQNSTLRKHSQRILTVIIRDVFTSDRTELNFIKLIDFMAGHGKLCRRKRPSPIVENIASLNMVGLHAEIGAGTLPNTSRA
jgi:hypothetical protein